MIAASNHGAIQANSNYAGLRTLTSVDRRRAQRAVDIVLACLGAAFCVGLAAGTLSEDGEYFPLASYSLFSIVPNVKKEYGVRIHEYGGRRVEPAVLYQQADHLGLEADSINAFYLVQRIGMAYARGRRASAERWRHLFERDFFYDTVNYEIVLLRYDPLERWATGRIRSMTSVGSFRRDA